MTYWDYTNYSIPPDGRRFVMIQPTGETQQTTQMVVVLNWFEDLKRLFSSLINKDYPRELYDRQFSIYVDNIQARIDLQREAFGKDEGIPARLFEVYDEWSRGLAALKDKYGPIVSPDQLIEAAELIGAAG